MGKPTICIGENKDADQLRGKADQRLCFRYTDSTIPLLLKSEISSFFSVLVQVNLCRTCSETTLLVFPRGGSNIFPIIPENSDNSSHFINSFNNCPPPPSKQQQKGNLFLMTTLSLHYSVIFNLNSTN